MKELRRLVVVVPAVLLAVLAVMLFLDRGAIEELAFLRRGQAGPSELVDQRPYQTAQTLAALAVSAEEQRFAQDAERLADHEVDQAFATALRLGDMRQRTLTGDAAMLAKHVDDLKAQVKADQASVDALTAAAKAAGAAPSPGDDLDVAQAQLGLDQDELTNAEGELARATGDRRGEIQQELSAREAAMKSSGSGPQKQTAVAAARQFQTLLGRARGWFAQRERAALLVQAEDEARTDAVKLGEQRGDLQKGLGDVGKLPDAGTLAAASGSDRVKLLKAMSARRAVMGLLDDRAQTDRQLASIYQRWQAQVWVQHHIVGYLLLESFASVVLIVLLAAVAAIAGRAAVRRVAPEPRRQQTLKTIVTLGVEVVALLAIALVVFGVPQQMPTIVGFATAGVTVVFQDFILAFFGWFSLMGRHGIRVGDWVEINSVSGEVAEITLFRTVLLETGNWTTRGHPTGRRMTFSNSFALKGQYFNFSTNGQWMWDEMTLNVPATANAYELIKQMQSEVEKATATDTALADAEWQRVAKNVGVGQFSAKPTVELRPAATGVDVVVRFVTRANERFGIRGKIDKALVGLMGGTERPAEVE